MGYCQYLEVCSIFIAKEHLEEVCKRLALFEGSQRVYCVVKVYVRLSIDGKTVETTVLADGSSGDLDVESLVRYVETRALKRAIGRALNLRQSR